MRKTMKIAAKKGLSLFLSLCLLFSLFPVLPAAAAETDPYLMTTTEPQTIERSPDTFYVPVNLVNGAAIAGYKITIGFDPAQVDLNSITADPAYQPAINFQNKANGQVVVAVADPESVTGNTNEKAYLFEIGFIPTATAQGSINLSLTGEFWDVDGNKLTAVGTSQVPDIGIRVNPDNVVFQKTDGSALTTLALSKSQTTTVVAKVMPADATDPSVVYASDNTDVVTVDQDGLVTAIATGSAVITATAENGLTATVPVTVTVPALKLSGISNQAIVSSDVTVVAQSAFQPITIKNKTTGDVLTSGIGQASKSFSADGSYELEITNGTETRTLGFQIMKTAPTITVTGVVDGQLNRNLLQGITPRVVFGASAAVKTVLLNGVPYTLDANGYGTPIAAPGFWKLTVTARDAAGNTATSAVTFENRYDMMPPVIGVSGVAQNGIYETATPVVTLQKAASVLEDDSNAANYTAVITLTRPNGSQTDYARGDMLPTLTTAGTYRLDVRAVNPSWTSLVSTSTLTFRIDEAAPTAAITGVADGALYNQTVSPVVTFSDDQADQALLWANATVTLIRNGDQDITEFWKNGDTLTGDGTHVLTARTKDAVNHVSNTVTRTFTIDRTKPVISLLGVLDGMTYKDTNITVSVKSSEPGVVTATAASGTTLPAKVVSEGFDTYTFNGVNGEVANYGMTFSTQDLAGNKTTRTLAFSIDRQPVNLLVSGVTEGQVLRTNPVITVAAYNGTTLLTEGLTMTMDGTAFTGGTYAGTEGAHTLVVRLAYNSQIYTKTIRFTLDKTAPALSSIAVQKNSQAVSTPTFVVKNGDVVKVSATVADASALTEVFLRVGTRTEKIPMTLTDGVWSATFTADSANDTNLSLTVFATDKAGNAASSAATARMDMDSQPPVVTMQLSPEVPSGRNGIYNDPSLMVTLSAGAGETVHWTLQNGSNPVVTGAPARTVEVQGFSDGLNQLVWYAVDAAGNQSQSQSLSFRYDTQAPATVTLSTYSTVTNSGTLTLSGTVPGETDTGTRVVVQKQMSVDGTDTYETVGQVNVTTDGTNGHFAIGGLRLTEGMNRFRLRAEDVAGNTSPSWNDANLTLDTSAPILSLAKVTDTTYALTANEGIQNITATFNGEAVLSIGALTDGKRIIETGALQEGGNVLLVNATDPAGNRGSGSLTISWIPPNTAQNDLPVSENTTLDIPAGAFDEATNMTVRTVEMDGSLQYKPVTAPLEFDFGGVTPSEPLLIRMFVGYELTGLTLIHDDDGVLVEKVAISIFEAQLDAMLLSETFPTDGTPYYIIDTGEIVFQTSNFSSYQVAQDNTAPVIRSSTVSAVINKTQWDAGATWSLVVADQDPGVSITDVKRNLVSVGIAAVTMGAAVPDGTVQTRTATLALNSLLQDGSQDVQVIVSDAAGNETTLTRTIVVDKTPVVLTAVPQRILTRDDSVLLTLSTSEDAAISYSRDGASWTAAGRLNGTGSVVVALLEGSNAYQVRATDTAGNVTTVTAATVTRDSTPPVITVTGIADGDVRGGTVTISVSVTEGALPAITLNGVPFASGSSVSVSGLYTLEVITYDAAGNEASEEIRFAIDTSVPVIRHTGVADGAVGNGAVTFTVEAENADVFTVTKSLNGGAPTILSDGTTDPVTETITGTAGQLQHWTITATATHTVDGQVRAASSTFRFTIDKKGPALVVNPVVSTTAEQVILTGTLDETADVYLNNVGKLEAQPAGSFSIAAVPLVVGNNAFAVKAVDALGNETIVNITVVRTETTGGGGTGGGGTGGGDPVVPGPVAPPAPVVPVAPTPEPLPRPVSTELPAVLEPHFGPIVAGAELPDVGMTGGVLTLGDGVLTLRIPAGTVTGEQIFRVVQFTLDPASVPAQANELTSGRLMPVSPVFDIGTTSLQLDRSVSATFAYDKSFVELVSRLRVFYWHTRLNAWMPVADAAPVVDAMLGTVTVDLNHFSRYCVMEVKENPTFADVAGEWFTPYVNRLALAGVTVGTIQNGVRSYLPSQAITRNEFTVMLCRALHIAPSTSVLTFDDASAIPAYAKGYVTAAVERGIVKGLGDGTFGGGKTITRAEMVTMLIRATGFKTSTERLAFHDAASIPSYAAGAVVKAVELRIIAGRDGNLFAPLATATRAEVAKVLAEMIEVLAAQ